MTRITAPRRPALGILAAAGAVLAATACSSTAAGSVTEGCTPEHSFSTVTPGTLTVSTYHFPPHMMVEGSTLTGVEGDLLAEIAKRECLTVTADTAGGAGAAIPSVQSGRSDLAAGDWWRTTARGEVVQLSAPVYLDQGAIVSLEGFETVADLEGQRIGSVAGNLWNEEFAAVFGDDFSVYQDPEAVFSDLAAGRIAAVIDSVGATTVRFEETPIEGATIAPLPYDERIPVTEHPGQLNWPTNFDNPELTAAVDAQLEALRADGTIARILAEYGLDESAADVGEPHEL